MQFILQKKVDMDYGTLFNKIIIRYESYRMIHIDLLGDTSIKSQLIQLVFYHLVTTQLVMISVSDVSVSKNQVSFLPVSNHQVSNFVTNWS